jgi:hypothetical protein
VVPFQATHLGVPKTLTGIAESHDQFANRVAIHPGCPLGSAIRHAFNQQSANQLGIVEKYPYIARASREACNTGILARLPG